LILTLQSAPLIFFDFFGLLPVQLPQSAQAVIVVVACRSTGGECFLANGCDRRKHTDWLKTPLPGEATTNGKHGCLQK
jgi:hypothetical protein